jgi:excisionase family DNA binding protein
MSVTLTVPQAAAYLGISERTVWRRINDGRLTVIRTGRRARVLVDRAEATRRLAETSAAYETEATSVDGLHAGPWPFTSENLARHRERLRHQRTAAFRELETVSRQVLPDPAGLTGVDYLRDIRDPAGRQPDDGG